MQSHSLYLFLIFYAPTTVNHLIDLLSVLDKTQQLEKDLSALQSELDRILYLLKIADPTGEAAKKRNLKTADGVGEAIQKRDLKAKEPKSNKSVISSIVKKQFPVESKDDNGTGKPENGFMQKEGSTDATAKPEAGEVLLDTTVGKSAAYTVAKPQWLGAAVHDRVTEESNPQPTPLHVHDSDEFVDYKDRKKILVDGNDADIKMESGLENAAPGLIIRKRKQVNEFEGKNNDAQQQMTSSSSAAELMAEDAVSLLLKHKKGYYVEDEENRTESLGEGRQLKKDKKKPKRVLGPEKPSFLDNNSEYETWVPPEG